MILDTVDRQTFMLDGHIHTIVRLCSHIKFRTFPRTHKRMIPCHRQRLSDTFKYTDLRMPDIICMAMNRSFAPGDVTAGHMPQHLVTETDSEYRHRAPILFNKMNHILPVFRM